MTYCLNVEGFSATLLPMLEDELGDAFSTQSVDGALYCFASDAARSNAEPAVSIHVEIDESTLFLETNNTEVAFHVAVLGRVVAFLADRGCEVTVAEV